MCSYLAFVFAATLLVLWMPATVTGQTFKCGAGTGYNTGTANAIGGDEGECSPMASALNSMETTVGQLSAAGASQVTAEELGKKADKTYVDTELAKKAVATTVTAELGKKADKTYVDTELAKKAVATTVTAALGRKADQTSVDAILLRMGAYEKQVQDLKYDKAAQDGKIKALGDENAAQDGKIHSLETSNAAKDAKIKALEDDNAAQDGKIQALETSNAAKDAKIEALEDDNAAQDGKIQALETSNAAKDSKIEALEDALQDRRAREKSQQPAGASNDDDAGKSVGNYNGENGAPSEATVDMRNDHTAWDGAGNAGNETTHDSNGDDDGATSGAKMSSGTAAAIAVSLLLVLQTAVGVFWWRHHKQQEASVLRDIAGQDRRHGIDNAIYGAASRSADNVSVPWPARRQNRAGAAPDASVLHGIAGQDRDRPNRAGGVVPGAASSSVYNVGVPASNIVYAVPFEDGRLVVPRVPNLLYQSADGPPNDGRSLAGVSNVMYQPAANNAYDAGVNSNTTA